MKCLIVREPFAGYIVDGVKCVEYRTKPTKIRGRIGIIQSKTGTVIGDVDLYYCKFEDELGLYCWYFSSARRYKTPVTYEKKRGAVVWENVDMYPQLEERAPELSYEQFRIECETYGKTIRTFLKNYLNKRKKA